MAKATFIACSMCGKDLYTPLMAKERRESGYKRIEYYVVSDNNQEDELCNKCFDFWRKSITNNLREVKGNE